MTKAMRGVGFFMVVGLLAGCATKHDSVRPADLSAAQRAAMQTKEMPGHFDTAFAAALSVLQDEGWQVDEVDRASGIIQASSLKRQALFGPADDFRPPNDPLVERVLKEAAKAKKKEVLYPEWTRWEQLTAHIEPWQTETVQIRLTIVKCGQLPSGQRFVKKNKLEPVPGKEQSLVVEDMAVYQNLFQKFQRAIFIRQGLEAK